MNDIKITVLMPCYNAAAYIADAIRSVLNQTFKEFELLIVNDGSTDNTEAIIRSFTDDRIALINQSQQGVAAALNNGLKHARAEYIARFDADDICYKERLEQQYTFMQANPDCIITGSAADYMDDAGNYIFTHFSRANTDAELKELPYTSCPFIHASVMYKRDEIAAIGYDINAHSFEDHLLWMNLRNKGEMHNMPERLLSVRLNISSLTIDERKRPKAFHRVKNKALRTGSISKADGDKISEIIKAQNNPKQKEGAYYSLLAKKFLWNNYNPPRSRENMKKAISIGNFDFKDYLLLGISYLPKRMIDNLYSLFAAGK